ncbi:MAG: hypothetical protein Q9161_001619 [Pseudevernia consocians]
MRPSLLGLGLLVPKTLGHLVIETVWVGTGDCSPTRGVGGSGVEGSDDRFGTETFAYTSTSSNGMVTDGIETSVYIITPAAVGSGAGGSSDRFGTEKLAHTSSSSNVIFTSGIEAPISPIIPASIASEATTVLVTSNNSNSAVTISITTSSTYPIIFTTASPQLGPLTVGTGTTTRRNSPGSTVEPTNTNVSITTGIGTSTYPIIQVSAASGTATVVIASTNSNSTVTTSTTTSSAYPIISTTGSPQPGSVTVGTNIKTTKNTETANSGTPGGSKNGGLAISSTDTRSSPTATPSPATNGSPGTTTNSGAEPTYSNINPTCSDNNTYYVDIFGIQYGIRCGLDFANPDGVSLKTHADTFEGCIQYCSLLKDCGGVRFSGTDCYPIATFRGYKAETADVGNDLLTAIPTNGASSGDITPDDLCAEGFDGQPFTDVFQCTWNIVCNQTIAGTALQPTIQTNFEACIYYCAFYDGCESVYFQGDGSSESIGEVEAVANCFPMSSIGAVSQDTLVSAASLNGTCNWPANQ